MTIQITIMAVSAAGMIALLVHKHLELSRGLETRVHDMRRKTDPVLSEIHQAAGRAVSHVTWSNIVLAVNLAFVRVVRFFMNVSHRVHKASSDLVEKASRKTEDLSKGGAASFYLKQIKESKDSSLSTTPTKEL
ncbi:MAG: hypothetical protein KGI79_02630 [Patescibacteria group bacterium]|nr:hypothetical protein [Patescibacteria group bacterium]MDE2116745.1 hypothetical protein [Patescibacteria group bacterium]